LLHNVQTLTKIVSYTLNSTKSGNYQTLLDNVTPYSDRISHCVAEKLFSFSPSAFFYKQPLKS